MDLDPRNYDLGELRGPLTKSDTDTGGTDHADEDDEDPGSTGGARRDVPESARDDDGRREPTGRARSERGGPENTEGDRERDAGSVPKADTDRNGEHTTPEEQNSASRHTPSSAGTRGARAGAERATADRYRRLVAVERTFDGDPKNLI